MDDGQKTSRGHPDFNSYMKILRVFIFQMDGRMDKQTDRHTDRQTEKLIWCGLGNLSVPPGTPTVRGLEELISAALERFLEPIHDLHVYCKI